MRSENTAGNRGKKDGYFGFSCLFSHELVIFVTLCLFVIDCVSTKSTTALYFVLYYFSEIFLNLFFWYQEEPGIYLERVISSILY